MEAVMLELERYELREGPAYRFELERRDFLKSLGGGMLLLLVLENPAAGQESGRARSGEDLPQEIAAWLHIGGDGKITVFTGKTEVGQNIRTSLTQAVAEELRAPVSHVDLLMADTDKTPFDMGTFGSRTTPTMAPQLRKVAAEAREMLIGMAAEQWKADRAAISVADGRMVNQVSGASCGYGELTKGQELVKTVAAGAVIRSPEGVSAPKVNARDFVTGRQRYSSDLTRPGMLHGRVIRPTAFNARLVSVDSKAAESMVGITVVHEGNFVGVAGPDELALERAAGAIQAQWSAEPQPSDKELFAYLKSHAEPAGDRAAHERGSVEEGLNTADHKLEATYTVAYIAHTPLEPRAAVAEWSNGKLTVWTGSQRPFGVRSELAEAFQIPENRVRVIVPDTGSGYGGKHTGECAIEAARLAKAAGKPVKLIWTREEEFTWAYARPAGVIEIRSGVKADGSLVAWEYHNYNSGPSGIATPYEIAHQKVAFHETQSPLRQGSYRGLAATANHFARECHMDELAHAANMDPLAFRLKNLQDARMRAVLEGAAEKFGWGKRQPSAGRGFGIACGFEKGGYVACCAEVTVARPSGTVKIERVVEAWECGAIVNPEHLKNQVEGSVVMGIGGALFEALQFENGRITNPQLSKYRVPRFSDLPAIETVLIDRKDLPSAGAGETPIVGLAPAVGNAIFDACGRRVRSLPMAPNGVKV
jgi:CO/xanthine dehydrogenase Mo-binding subunit